MSNKSRISPKSVLSLCAGVACLAAFGAVGADTIVRFGDEDPALGTFTVSNMVTTFSLNAPLICADLGTPTGTFATNKIVATWPGVTPANGKFLFGPNSAGSPTPIAGLGSWTFSPTGGLTIAQSDPVMVCYSLSAAGARKPTIGLFVDDFEPPFADAKATIRVVQLPTADNFYVYRYYLDVTIPVVSPSVATTFLVRDGYDSSVFSGVNYCKVAISDTSCGGNGTTSANVDDLVSLGANQSFSRRYIVQRQLRSGVTSLPPTAKPLVLGAVFAPNDLDTRLDNNIAAGFTALSDFAPAINTTGTSLSGLVEGSSLLARSFTLSDDSNESVGQLLGADVSINFNGTIVSAPVNCGSTSPQSGPGASRSCSFDVVPPSTDFATDGATPGTYAAGMTASVTITAHDPLGQQTIATLPLHVASGDNDAPVATLSGAAVPDAGNGNMPTLTCSLATFAAETPDPGCVGIFGSFLSGVAAGPATSVDELITQTAAAALGSNNSSHPGYKFLSGCALDDGSLNIFAPNGQASFVSSVAGSYDLGYWVNGINTGSATCTVTVNDAQSGGFPAGQVAQSTTKTFRIVVLP